MVYRARGINKETNRKAWVTISWRNQEQDAKDDIRMFGDHYTQTWIEKRD